MFEDVKKDDQNVAVGDPSQVEDVFDEIDPAPEVQSAVQGGRLQPVQSAPIPNAVQDGVPQQQGQGTVGPPKPLTNLGELDEWSGKKKSKRGLIIAVILLIVIAAGGAYAAYVFFIAQSGTPEVTQPTNEVPSNAQAPIEDQIANPPVNTNTVEETIPNNSSIDADGDGLTDLEEQVLGTDPTDIDTDSDGLNDRDEVNVHKTDPLNSDSDNDGLSDRDEIFVWITNPLNSDTDGDTYLDGAEVDAGYSPTGPGRLVDDAINNQ